MSEKKINIIIALVECMLISLMIICLCMVKFVVEDKIRTEIEHDRIINKCYIGGNTND